MSYTNLTHEFYEYLQGVKAEIRRVGGIVQLSAPEADAVIDGHKSAATPATCAASIMAARLDSLGAAE